VRRCHGLVWLTFAGLGWIGLLSWELPLPGQSTGTGSLISHFIGRVPAAVADFLLQGFGIGAALAFAVPTFWGIELLARRRLGRPMLRLLMWPASVLATSGALSGLPAPTNWPFARGLGGMVGDQLFAFTRMLASLASPSLAGLAAGALLAIAALILFAVITGGPAGSGTEDLKVTRGEENPREINFGVPVAPAIEDVRFGGANVELDLDTVEPQPVEIAEDERWREAERAVRMAPPQKGRFPAFTRSIKTEVPPDEADTRSTQLLRPLHVPYDDLPDDDESAQMARRFAPAGSRPHQIEDEVSSEPPPWMGWKDLLGRASDAEAPPPAVPRPELAEDAQYRYEPESPAVRTWPEAGGAYRMPAASLLARHPSAGQASAGDNSELVALARRLEAVLVDFGVRCRIVRAVPGPAVTQFEIEIAPGIKSSRVIGLAEEIAKAAGTQSARVVPVPGRASLLIELPNAKRDQVFLRDLLESKFYRQTLHTVPLALGVAADRKPIVVDLASLTGLLIAGGPSTGKSAMLSTLLVSMLLRYAPSELRLLIIDPNNSGQTAFNAIGHLVAPAVTETSQAVSALEWCVVQMDERLKSMSKLNLRGIGTYNNAVRNALRQGTGFKRSVQTGFDRVSGRAIYEEEIVTPEAMPYIVVVIDDLDALMQVGGPRVGAMLQRLGQSAGSAGIHFIAATTQHDGRMLSSGTGAPFPARLCFKVANRADSRMMVGDGGAESLLGDGDFLFSVGGTPVRGQAPMLAEGDLSRVVEAIQRQVQPSYEASILDGRRQSWPQADPAVVPLSLNSIPGRRPVVLGRGASA